MEPKSAKFKGAKALFNRRKSSADMLEAEEKPRQSFNVIKRGEVLAQEEKPRGSFNFFRRTDTARTEKELEPRIDVNDLPAPPVPLPRPYTSPPQRPYSLENIPGPGAR